MQNNNIKHIDTIIDWDDDEDEADYNKRVKDVVDKAKADTESIWLIANSKFIEENFNLKLKSMQEWVIPGLRIVCNDNMKDGEMFTNESTDIGGKLYTLTDSRYKKSKA